MDDQGTSSRASRSAKTFLMPSGWKADRGTEAALEPEWEDPDSFDVHCRLAPPQTKSVDAGRGKRWRISIYLLQVQTSPRQVEADGLKPRVPIRTSMSMNEMKVDSARSMSPPFDNSCRL